MPAAPRAAFMAVLAEHRRLLEPQLAGIHITLTEISQHESRCRSLLATPAPKNSRRRAA